MLTVALDIFLGSTFVLFCVNNISVQYSMYSTHTKLLYFNICHKHVKAYMYLLYPRMVSMVSMLCTNFKINII